jgi:hypothetical protein
MVVFQNTLCIKRNSFFRVFIEMLCGRVQMAAPEGGKK